MTALQWSRVTDLLDAVIAQPHLRRALLEPEPLHIREEVDRLLAAHRALESAQAAGRGADLKSNPADLAVAGESVVREFLKGSWDQARPSRILRGRYQLESLLGSGGSGEAWLCQDLPSGDLVVVKLARHWEWFRADLKHRFQAEVDILRSLEHPGIIRILDSGETDEGAPFLVMPFIDGLTLRALLEVGPLRADSAASIIEQLGAAISGAHKANVTHRDIKPENVMLQTQTDGSLRVFLIDFGIALFADLEQQSGTTTRFFGTTQYMAPEQLLGKPVPASDTYALALVSYEMLCGEPLFKAQTPVALYDEARQLKESHLSVQLAANVRLLLCQALRLNPEKRPPSSEAFARKLAAEIRQPGWRLPSRRTFVGVGLGTLGVAVPGAALLNYEYGQPRVAERTVNYRAGQTFRTVGWQKVGTIDEDITLFDSAGYIIGNSLASSKQGGYFFPLSRRVERSGLKRPWHAIFFIRPIHGESAFAVCFPGLGLRFVGTVVAPDEGLPFVRLIESYTPAPKDRRAALKLNRQHLQKFELRFDPAKQCASLGVDGQLVLDGYRGSSEYLEVPGVSIGLSTVQSTIGEGIFGDIRFLME